jgi:hypothetical protein
MCSVPPRTGVPDDDVEEVELPPHAARPRAAAVATTATVAERLGRDLMSMLLLACGLQAS